MHRATSALAIYATAQAVHTAMHPLCDHVVQSGADAVAKRTPAGQAACARHVASYTAVQVATLTAVTRTLGLRLPWRAVAAGAAVNAITHYFIDRGPALRTLSRWAGKTGYIEHCQAVRRGQPTDEQPDGEWTVEETGPGTAWLEIDKALHHTVSVAASLLTAWLADRSGR